MCREPLTVGGGVSIEKISARVLERSKPNVPSASQWADQRSSRPSRVGFAGISGMVLDSRRAAFPGPLADFGRRSDELVGGGIAQTGRISSYWCRLVSRYLGGT